VLLILEIKGSRSRDWSALVSKCRKCQVTVNDSVGDDKLCDQKESVLSRQRTCQTKRP
jgi:hypothetical protein